MSYHGHTTTRPRSALVIVGGMIAWMGLVLGAMIATPEYHRAMTMSDEPVEMTWHELAENGLTDNSYVRLIDVELDQSNPLDVFEDMFMNFDPEAAIEDQQEAIQAAAENIDFGQMAMTGLKPFKVYPKGEDPAKFKARIVVPQTGWASDAAIRQIEESGTLTGRFTNQTSDSFELAMAKTLIDVTDIDGKIQDAVDQGNGVAEGEVEPDMPGEADVEGLLEQFDEGPQWVFEPVHAVASKADAQQWFWLSFCAVAFGLVICGAGGPSIVCCVFFQGPSILSILGYPMRYGRAGRTTRIVYACIGIGLMWWGYNKMVVEGRFGQLDGDIALASLGYVASSVGAAALLGSIMSVVAQKLNVSLDPKTTKKFPEPKMSYTEACSLEPVEAEMASGYVDPELTTSYDNDLPDALSEVADSLETVGFGAPEPVAWLEGEAERPAVIQLGCQEMVVSDVEELEGEVRSRLVSVLQDGMTIVTLSRGTPASSSLRFGTNGVYMLSSSDEPMEMLASHLEQTVSMAEKRDTTVVAIEAREATDVALFGRRVLADIRAQYGDEHTEVGDYSYGRFRFPCAPVAELASV